MKNKKKNILSLSLIVALLAVIVGGTYAYFSDTTEQATNTFTVGNVDIKLKETPTANGGRDKAEGKEPEEITKEFTGNEYHLVPGVKYHKDPQVTVTKGSEDSYVFIKVEINNDFVELLSQGEYKVNEVNWTPLSEPLSENIYYRKVNKNDTLRTFDVLNTNTFIINSGLDNAHFKHFNPQTNDLMTVTAYAIQAEGFEDADAAWNALNKQ